MHRRIRVMVSLLSQQLLLGSAKAAAQQVSLDAAAWTSLAERGLVTVASAGAASSPAVIITITAAGRAAQLAAAGNEADP
jgi:hypothetical protein